MEQKEFSGVANLAAARPDHRRLFESMPGSYLLLSPELDIVAVSDRYLLTTGTRRENLLGQRLVDVFPSRGADRSRRGVENLKASLQRVLASSRTDEMAIEHGMHRREPDGGGIEERHWRTVNAPVLGESGRVEYVIHSVEDVTEQVRLQQRGVSDAAIHEKLVRSEEHFGQLLDTAPDAMVIVRTDGRIQFVNLKCEQMFGYARTELIGEHLELLIPERFRPDHGRHLARFFALPDARPMGSGLELFGRRKDGSELPIEVSISPLRSGGEMTVSASLRDISERKASEARAKLEDDRQAEELRAARTAAEAGSAAKSEFLSSMSHELRTPLNGILGFSQLLVRDQKQPLPDRHRERVRQIERSGQHLLRLIDDILDLSRIEAGGVTISTEPVDVAALLEEVTATLEPLGACHGVTVAIDPSEAAPTVAADRTRFAQILMNFGSNGIKYNISGGTVRFSVSSSEGHVRVVVRDSGVGIPLEKQRKLFQPFQRAGQEAGPIEGTGIGLVITQRLARLMQGDVGFKSVTGQGSEFWVDLPLHIERAPSKPPPAALSAAMDRLRGGGSRLVLYVEDNPGNVAFMRDLVSGFEGIELLVATTAEAAIDLAFSRRPELIIMDLNLPGMSGLEALKTLQRTPALAHIPVIALTAAATAEDRCRGERAGFYRYLTKPVNVEEFSSAIEAALEHPEG